MHLGRAAASRYAHPPERSVERRRAVAVGCFQFRAVRDEKLDEPIPAAKRRAVQRSLPELKFSVHIYSEDPASRRVKIGERMMREGQRITPQVRLEEIIPKGVILSYQEYRFRMNAL